ncbi:MAG: hypothetical protein IJH04_07970 [Eggerthellaceae bacterium]|nr:hypothetical protein [Eggerthellaceae bacterium]
MRYGDLLEAKATETEIDEFLADGDMTAIAFRIPRNLKDSAVEVARRKGMSFSAFVRMSMIDELAKERRS